MKKKLGMLVSSVTILAHMIPAQTAFAADATTCEFSLLCTDGSDGSTVHPGDEVTLTLCVNPNGDTLGFEFQLGELPEGFTYVEDSLTYLDSAKSKLGWTDYNAYTDGRIGFFINDDSKVYAGGAINLATLKIKVGNDADIFNLSDSEYFATSIALDTMGEEVAISFPVVPILTVPSLELVPTKEASCKEEGSTEYFKCSDDCGRIYKTNDRTQPTTLDEVKIVKTEHDFTAETVDADFLKDVATCSIPATYFKSCTICGEKGTETFEDPSGTLDSNNHVNVTVKQDTVKAATCTEEGYSGDGVCADCGNEFANGSDIPATGHKGGEATCIAKAICEVCGEEYGDIAPDNHVNTEIRNSKEATETEEGYTGDTYCLDCDTIAMAGESIPKLSSSNPTPTPPTSDIGSVSSPSSSDATSSDSNSSHTSSDSVDSSSTGETSMDSSSSSDNISSSTPADSNSIPSGNPSTGITIALAPIILVAGAAVVVAKNKRR